MFVEHLLNLSAVLQLRKAFNSLNLAIGRIPYDVELVGHSAVLVYVEAVHDNSLDASAAVLPEHDEHDPALGVFSVVRFEVSSVF